MRNNDASEGTLKERLKERTNEHKLTVQLWRSTSIIDLVVAQPSKQTCGVPNIEWNVWVNVIKSSI